VPKLKPACPRKTKNSCSPWSHPVGGKVEELPVWSKGFLEKMSFEPGVVEWRRLSGVKE